MPKRCLTWPNLWSTLKQGQQKVYFWPKNWSTQPLSRLNLRWLVQGQNIWFFKVNFMHRKLVSFVRKGFSIKKLEQSSWYLVIFLVHFYHWNTLSSKQNLKKILRLLHSQKSRLTITVPYQDLFTPSWLYFKNSTTSWGHATTLYCGLKTALFTLALMIRKCGHAKDALST